MIARICEVLETMQRSLASLKGEEKVGGQLRFCLSASIRSPQTSLGEREAREREWLFRRAASIRLTAAHRPVSGVPRSEEHTSELSHRTISYAVFCLKKKKIYKKSIR